MGWLNCEVSEASAGSTCIWRKLADSGDRLLPYGIRCLKGLQAEHCR